MFDAQLRVMAKVERFALLVVLVSIAGLVILAMAGQLNAQAF